MKLIKIFLFSFIIILLLIILVNLNNTSENSYEIEESQYILQKYDNLSKNITITSNMKLASLKSNELMKLLVDTMNSSKVLSGQNIGNSNYYLEENYEASVIKLERNTGKVPAILSVDYAWEEALDNYDETNRILERHLEKGGIVMISIHLGNPFLGGGLYEKGTGNFEFDDVFEPGTKPYILWQENLEKIADGLETLQRDNTILWRPLHEMNGNWFWWSGGDEDQITQKEFKKLWLSMYTYFEERELHNLLWVYSPNSNHDTSSTIDVLTLYPGDEVVDIVALDYYDDTFSLLNKHDSIKKLLSLNKPFGFAEIGQQSRKEIDNRDVLNIVKENFPQTAFAVHWHTNTNQKITVPRSIVDNYYPEEYLNDERTITLEELK